MSILKWILGGLVGLVLAFIGIGMLLPRNIVVERSITIDAPAQAVFPHVNSPKATEAWSPWLERDPKTKVTYGNVEAGVGATMAWSSDDPQVGEGTMKIVESTLNSNVKLDLDFGDMGLATAYYILNEAEEKTTVIWGMEADMGFGPIGRWIGLMMDNWVGADYEKGLLNLKQLVEG